MNKKECLEILLNAYIIYVDNFDVIKGIPLPPMTEYKFIESLLTYEDGWYDRWINEYYEKYTIKKQILNIMTERKLTNMTLYETKQILKLKKITEELNKQYHQNFKIN